MAINLVDTVDSVGNTSDLEKDLREAVTQSAAAAKASTSLANPAGTKEQQPSSVQTSWKQVVLDGEDVPEKFRGKTAAEVLESHRNLESAYGRMANDLGTQRKMTDRLLDLKRDSDLSSNSVRELPDVKSTELLEKPAEVIDRIVSERLQALQTKNAEAIREQELANARERFFERHSDYETVANDPEFIQWLKGSPYRSRAAQQAASGNWDVADELVSEYKDRKSFKSATPAKAQQLETNKDQNIQAARAASLESSSAPEQASGHKKKTYKRTDLITLRVNKPEVYYDDAFQQEILSAYAEGRVV